MCVFFQPKIVILPRIIALIYNSIKYLPSRPVDSDNHNNIQYYIFTYPIILIHV